MFCHSNKYKNVVFVVRCPALLLQILRFAQKDIPCHQRRSRRRSEGSGVPHWQPPVILKVCIPTMPPGVQDAILSKLC